MSNPPAPHRNVQILSKPFVLSATVIATLLAGGAVWYQNNGVAPALPPLIDLESALRTPVLAVTSAPVMAALDLESAPAAVTRQIEVGRGDTLMGLLVDAGAERRDAHQAITALAKEFSPRDLKPGQAINLAFATTNQAVQAGKDASGQRLVSLSLRPSIDSEVIVARQARDGGFEASTIERPLSRDLSAGSGTVVSSLFLAGREAGVSGPAMIELIRAFSFDVDFQREIQKDDGFEVLYETFTDINGEQAKTGDVLYATLILGGNRIELYRFTPESGRTDYFGPDGKSVRKTLMRTPIDGARISSGFGRRKHPVLGYTKMHRGTDFAASRGTPVYAAGDGVIERSSRYGAYGNYIRIRHNGTYKTAYAHLNGYAKGVRSGVRVKQGQVIGYVGTTGRSTGPHLHYEVHVNGKQVNPRTIKMPSGEKLQGKDLEAFAAAQHELQQLYQETLNGAVVADSNCAEDTAPWASRDADTVTDAPTPPGGAC